MVPLSLLREQRYSPKQRRVLRQGINAYQKLLDLFHASSPHTNGHECEDIETMESVTCGWSLPNDEQLAASPGSSAQASLLA